MLESSIEKQFDKLIKTELILSLSPGASIPPEVNDAYWNFPLFPQNS